MRTASRPWSRLSRLGATTLLLAACAPETAPSDDALALSGAWRVRTTLVSSSCEELSDIAPLDPGAVALSVEGTAWTVEMLTRDTHWTELAPGHWAQSGAGVQGDCRLERDAEWRFGAVGPTAFSSALTESYVAYGPNCPDAGRTCELSWVVRGAR